MPKVDFEVSTELSTSARAKQLSALFDVPPADRVKLSWSGDFPFDEQPFNVGLIVGPSGSGKTQMLKRVFGEPVQFEWKARSVIDDFSPKLATKDVAAACQAVGFNTIPAWLRPYSVLSNGEQFRVDIARRLLELDDPVVVDEFTSVVDRQVAQIGANAVQKFIRKADRRFVAASCHYDIIDWLQPDWIFEPATMTFSRRLLQRRPQLAVEVERVPYPAWRLFAPFHYLTAELNKAARCFVLFVGERPAAFSGMLYRPHPKVKDVIGCSRLVTLPDWQGLGLALALIDKLGAAYRATGRRVHTYPAHPALIRSFANSPCWTLRKPPGRFSAISLGTGSIPAKHFGGRPNATFEYCGPAMDRQDARRLLGD